MNSKCLLDGEHVNCARCSLFQAISYPYADPYYGGAVAAYGAHAIVSDIYAIPVPSLISGLNFSVLDGVAYYLLQLFGFLCASMCPRYNDC